MATEKNIPLVCHFDLSYQCNLRCVHCYIVSDNRPELNTDEVKNILEQLARAGTLYLTLSGGELFTRKDLFEIATFARELHFALRLLTNGTMIGQKEAEAIARLHPEKVGISIYSTDAAIHDGITGVPRSLERSIAAARALRRAGVRVKISTVIMKQNLHAYQAVYHFAKELGAECQADYRLAPKNDRDSFPLNFHIDRDGIRQVFSDGLLFKESDLAVELHSGLFHSRLCGASHMAAYISPYGDVYPCVQLPLMCGNLRELSFEDIWTESAVMKQVRSIRIADLTACSTCALIRYCRPCIGLSYLEERSLLAPLKRACEEAAILKATGEARRKHQ